LKQKEAKKAKQKHGRENTSKLKIIEAKKQCFNFTMVRSKNFEGKRSENNFFFA
jgi:plasmid maintenance system killer protein